MESYLDKLVLSVPLRDPVMRRAIRELGLPEGSHGLDGGCGIGSHTLLLAEAVGPAGSVTGLDVSAEFLAHASELARETDIGGRVSFRRGDVNHLPFEDDRFDWAWSVDCVGHPTAGDPVAALRELARVVRPGGPIVILVYSGQMLLPGHAPLEARLNATASAMTRLAGGQGPEADPLRALRWFHEVALVDPRARTVVGSVQAPLDEGIRRALVSLFGMLWGERQSSMDEADRTEYRRLTRPESPDFILGTEDYYAFFTYSIFEGRVGHCLR